MVRTYNQTNASSLGGYFEAENGTQRIHPQVSGVCWLEVQEYNIGYYTFIWLQKMSKWASYTVAMYKFVYIALKCNTLHMFYGYFEYWTTMSDVSFPKFSNVFSCVVSSLSFVNLRSHGMFRFLEIYFLHIFAWFWVWS